MTTARLTQFEALRPRLFAIAYRMTATRADADDIVQDAWLRWDAADVAAIASAEAWLVTVTTRLAIDRLRTRKAERETYTGYWLPEPLVELDEESPERIVERASDVSFAFLWLLERLAPEERAAFLMRQVFDQDYADIAAMLGKSEAACRQMVHRAQQRVQQETPRFAVPRATHRDLLAKFVHAAAQGDRKAMRAMMSDEVEFVADGGGKVQAFLHRIQGAGRVAGLYWWAEQQTPGQVVYRHALVNGSPGLLRYIGGTLESAQAFTIEDERITGVYVIRNPDKLRALPALSQT